MHHRIADKDNLNDQIRVDFGFVRDLCDQSIHGLAHGSCHFKVTTGVHHCIAYPAHQIFAKADLRVHQSGTGNHCATAQIC